VLEKQQKAFFSLKLLTWNKSSNKRSMPWKGEKDPYKIWLSEIILQQTRVEQGLAYYERFIIRFPTICSLADAAEADVFKLWEGLGYYSRCRNLLHTAKYIHNELGGVFPDSFEGLLSLKGIGEYTASAIGSFAFGLPYAVVDGNVLRVLTRVFGIDDPIDQTAGRALLNKLAQELIDKKQPGNYNQAIMDFGATICKPMQPICLGCPFEKNCIALKENRQAFFPVKSPKKKPRDRWFNYLVLIHNGDLLVKQRLEKDIWEKLYEFFLKEENGQTLEKSITDPSYWGLNKSLFKNSTVHLSQEFIHQLTHQTIHCRFLRVNLQKKIEIDSHHWVSSTEALQYAFPRLITKYVESLPLKT
jgi:A/G-specific adenine glycosylase